MKLNFKIIGICFFLGFINCSHKTEPYGPDITLTGEESEIIIVRSLLIDDFDGMSGIAGSWSAEDDSAPPNNGNSLITYLIKTNILSGKTNRYAKVEYTLGPNYVYRYVMLQNQFLERDLSQYNGLRFFLRGSGHQLRIIIRSDSIMGSNYDDYGYVLPATPARWTEYIISFSDFQQEGWGTQLGFPKIEIDEVLKKVNKIQFKASSKISGESGYFEIDDLSFVTFINKR